jgi:hypothetical protein
MKTILEIRKLISSVYWDLKKDVEQMDTSDIYFDVGYMTSLCVAINKIELGQKIHDKFALK